MAAGCAGVAVLMVLVVLFWPSAAQHPIMGSDTTPIAPRPLPSGLDQERYLFQEPLNPDGAVPPPDAPEVKEEV